MISIIVYVLEATISVSPKILRNFNFRYVQHMVCAASHVQNQSKKKSVLFLNTNLARKRIIGIKIFSSLTKADLLKRKSIIPLGAHVIVQLSPHLAFLSHALPDSTRGVYMIYVQKYINHCFFFFLIYDCCMFTFTISIFYGIC